MPATNEILQGRYRIVAQLGQNGTGPIYEAYDETLKTDVILREILVWLGKVTTPSKMDSMKAAFAQEANILSGITHEAFIRIRDHFSDTDRHYLVLEPAEGEYLTELLEKNGGPFPVAEVSGWADRMLEGLHHLHTKMPPMFHGDIKPQNIKVNVEGKVKILALSVARDPEKGSSITEQAFDATALHYLPLEQIWGNLDLASQKVIAANYDETSEEILMQPPDARSDIYGLGATLYHLFTGYRPMDALERSIDILEGKSDPLQTPTKLNPSVPPEISYVLMKAMEIRREKRFESVLLMRQVLKTAAVRAKERETQEAKKNPAIAAPEIRLPEPVRAVPPAPVAKESASETDPARQLEMIKARLQEAENRRLAAEQRASDAERRLHEKEIETSKSPDVVAYAANEAQILELPEPAVPSLVKTAPGEPAQVLEMPVKSAVKPRTHQKEEQEFAFSYEQDAPKASGSQWKLLAAAAVLVVVGGGAFGIWTMISPGAAGPIQAPVMSLNDTAKPDSVTADQSAQPIPAPAGETQAQAANETAPVSDAPAQTAGSVSNPAAMKTRAAAPQPTKPAIAAKTPAKQKKAITVDDLINDN
jgi:eukaryotic-like serine/threonine-protein kinase